MKRQLSLPICSLTVLTVAALAAAQTPVGTAITYQGRLTDGGTPANGTYDMEFRLYDALTVGSQVGSTVSADDQSVSNGLFTVSLDFGGGAFTGDARWLEMAVRPGESTNSADFVTLNPRQPMTPAPYALHAMSAPGGVITKSGSGSIAMSIPATSSQAVVNLNFGYTFATAPAVMITGTTAGGEPALLIPHATNITAAGFDLVVSNPSGAAVSGLYRFNWIATATGGNPQTWYRDGDGDGYSDGSSQTREGDPPPGYFPASYFVAISGDCDDSDPAANPEAAEVCDGIDNNCEGHIDEDLAGMPCPLDQGVCEGITTICDGYGGVTCAFPPSYEQIEATCDGLDNDCDGLTDEDTGGNECPAQAGVCLGAVTDCVGGQEICDYGPDFEETEVTCDYLDNDCDGTVDEEMSGMPCSMDVGVCAGTMTQCDGSGGVMCDYGPFYEESETACDGLDNDCDGETDEGC